MFLYAQLSKLLMAELYLQDDVDIKEGFSDVTAAGQLLQSGSSLIGSKITKVSVYASTNTGTITGNATCTIQDNSGSVQATIGTADTSSLTSATPTTYTLVFQNSTNSYQMAEGDRVVIAWGIGDDPANQLWLWRSNGSTISNSTMQYYATSWASRDGDLSGKFEGTGPNQLGGTLLPPPVAWI